MPVFFFSWTAAASAWPFPLAPVGNGRRRRHRRRRHCRRDHRPPAPPPRPFTQGMQPTVKRIRPPAGGSRAGAQTGGAPHGQPAAAAVQTLGEAAGPRGGAPRLAGTALSVRARLSVAARPPPTAATFRGPGLATTVMKRRMAPPQWRAAEIEWNIATINALVDTSVLFHAPRASTFCGLWSPLIGRFSGSHGDRRRNLQNSIRFW